MASLALPSRFRGFIPVVVDVETGGLNPNECALLELAVYFITIDRTNRFTIANSYHWHVYPHPDTRIDQEALAINKIKPYHALRFAVSELTMLQQFFAQLSAWLQQTQGNKIVLVGHNAAFDLSFIQSACRRNNINLTKSPLHRFTTFDTATLAAFMYGETVLAQALAKAGIRFNEQEAHGALYDAYKTAELFCRILNNCPFFPF